MPGASRCLARGLELTSFALRVESQASRCLKRSGIALKTFRASNKPTVVCKGPEPSRSGLRDELSNQTNRCTAGVL